MNKKNSFGINIDALANKTQQIESDYKNQYFEKKSNTKNQKERQDLKKTLNDQKDIELKEAVKTILKKK